MPPSMNAIIQKITQVLSFDGFVNKLKGVARNFKDIRTGSNTQYSMQDMVLSAFSVFYLQCPSFLSYQESMETEQGNNNARTLFGVGEIPTDNHTRTLLDEEEPRALFPMFHHAFDGLVESGLIDKFKSSRKDLLIAFDGVEHHNSTNIYCSQCKMTHRKGEQHISLLSCEENLPTLKKLTSKTIYVYANRNSYDEEVTTVTAVWLKNKKKHAQILQSAELGLPTFPATAEENITLTKEHHSALISKIKLLCGFEEVIHYSHAMVTAVLLKPGFPHVIDLPPEFIVPQDGHDKQDSELAAAKRWLSQHASRYQEYGVTLLGDDLYSHQPFCEEVLKAQFHFIFTCKPDSHKTLYEYVEGLKKTNLIEQLKVSRWTGKRREIDNYFYINGLPLRDGNEALKVNWCEIISTDENGKVLYCNAFVTDHLINEKNVADIVKEGRSRWKTENENNNTLKNHGYHLDHNYGHGKKNLSNVLATLNLIAFLLHTILALTSEAYQKIRVKLGARKKFFEHIRTLVHYILFKSWDDLMCFMMDKLKLKFNTS